VDNLPKLRASLVAPALLRDQEVREEEADHVGGVVPDMFSEQVPSYDDKDQVPNLML